MGYGKDGVGDAGMSGDANGMGTHEIGTNLFLSLSFPFLFILLLYTHLVTAGYCAR